MKPTLGRIVHVASDSLEPRPAIIVAVNDDDTINVQLFEDRHAGYVYMGNIVHEAKWTPYIRNGHDLFWRWPPREDSFE